MLICNLNTLFVHLIQRSSNHSKYILEHKAYLFFIDRPKFNESQD